MDASGPSRTSASLLGRLRHEPGDGASWAEFARKYEPLVRGWCRRWRLQEADAQDIAQDVLARLADRMRSFQYDPGRSFRGYVKTLAHFAWCDFLAARARPGAAGSGDERVVGMLDNQEAREDLQSRMADAFDREVLDEAVARVRLRVEPRTFEAFRLAGFEGLPGAEVASMLGMEVASVFKAKSRVRKMLGDEVLRIERDW